METWTSTILPWLGTYALHSTALLLLVMWLCRVLPRESHRAQEWLWRTALLGPIVTTSLQAGLPFDPALGRFALPSSQPELAQLPVVHEPAAEGAPSEGPWDEWIASAPAETPTGTLAFERETERTGPTEVTVRVRTAWVDAEGDQPTAPSRVVGVLPPDYEPSQPETEAALTLSTAPAPLPTPHSDPSVGPRWNWTYALTLLWTFGGVLGVLVLATAWRRLMDRLAGRTEIRSGPLVDTLQELCDAAGRRRRPRLCLSPKLGSPATVGIGRSQICVPALALTDLTAEQQRAMLGHELAHILRHDPQWFFVYRLVERVFFFQPLNRVARRQMQELAEFQCDDWAAGQMGQGFDLAQCLTEVASWMLREKPQVALLPMAGQGSLLGHRVRRLLDDESRTQCRLRRPWVLPLAGGLLASAAWALPSLEAAASEDAQEERRFHDDETNESPAAPTEETVEQPIFPDATPDPSATHAPETVVEDWPEPATPSTSQSLQRFGAELDELEGWIRELEGQAQQLGQENLYATELGAMRAQIESLRQKQRRLQELLRRLP